MVAPLQLGALNYTLSPAKLAIKNITSAYTVVANDNGFVIRTISGTGAVTLPNCASVGEGFWIIFTNSTTSQVSVSTGTGNTLSDGSTAISVERGQSVELAVTNSSSAGVWQIVSNGICGSAANSIAIGGNAYGGGAASIAVGQSADALGSNCIALGASTSAGTNYSVAIGQNSGSTASTTATGAGAMALGGSYASGADSFAAAVANNTSTYGAQGANSVAIGKQAKATGGSDMALGQDNAGVGSVASGSGSLAMQGGAASGVLSIAIGRGNVASSTSSLALGRGSAGGASTASTSQGTVAIAGGTATGTDSLAIGLSCTASATGAVALGNNATAGQIGKFAFSNSIFAGTGDAQTGTMVLRGATTNATPLVITSDAAAAGAANQVTLSNNQAMAVRGQVICRESVAGADAAAGWEFTGIIRRGANAASTALVAAITPTLIATDAGLATAAIAITADTTNGCLKVEVTGIAATNLRWVCTVTSTECVYA